MEPDLKPLWSKTLQMLKESDTLAEGSMTWIEKTTLFKIEKDEAYISFRTGIASDLIHEHQQIFEETLSEQWGAPLKIRLISQREMEEMMPKEIIRQKTDQVLGHKFDEAYTFDSFVRGPSNQEALAACMSVCRPNNPFPLNPLLIYGTSGLGKTHMLNAVGNALKRTQPQAKVMYFYAGDLVSLMLEAMRMKNESSSAVEAIKENLIACDYFLVDDIQNLRSQSCQEVFFTIFNELIHRKKQIILTSDTHPSEIPTLTKRLISRFSSGLIVNISKPGAETAKQILKKKIEGHEDIIDIEDDVLDFLAVSYGDDVRALEGVLNRLLFNVTLFNPPSISMKFAMGVLKDEPFLSKNDTLDAKSVKKAVTRYYGLSYADLEGKSRQKKITQARNLCIFLMREDLDLPYSSIGREMGGRDHTTIASAYNRAKKLIETDASWKEACTDIRKRIK